MYNYVTIYKKFVYLKYILRYPAWIRGNEIIIEKNNYFIYINMQYYFNFLVCVS